MRPVSRRFGGPWQMSSRTVVLRPLLPAYLRRLLSARPFLPARHTEVCDGLLSPSLTATSHWLSILPKRKTRSEPWPLSRVESQSHPFSTCRQLAKDIHLQRRDGGPADRRRPEDATRVCFDAEVILPSMPPRIEEVNSFTRPFVHGLKAIGLEHVASAAGQGEVGQLISPTAR